MTGRRPPGPAGAVPPGWPAEVRPPGTPDWQRSAVGWLLDLCPPDYRGYAVVTGRPVALAWLAARHVEASLTGVRRAVAGVRADLGDVVEPAAMSRLVEVLETEQARLLAASRGVALVEEALRGRRHVPRW